MVSCFSALLLVGGKGQPLSSKIQPNLGGVGGERTNLLSCCINSCWTHGHLNASNSGYTLGVGGQWWNRDVDLELSGTSILFLHQALIDEALPICDPISLHFHYGPNRPKEVMCLAVKCNPASCFSCSLPFVRVQREGEGGRWSEWVCVGKALCWYRYDLLKETESLSLHFVTSHSFRNK